MRRQCLLCTSCWSIWECSCCNRFQHRSAFLPSCADRFYLRRFLRARQHDLGRAKAMFLVSTVPVRCGWVRSFHWAGMQGPMQNTRC